VTEKKERGSFSETTFLQGKGSVLVKKGIAGGASFSTSKENRKKRGSRKGLPGSPSVEGRALLKPSNGGGGKRCKKGTNF